MLAVIRNCQHYIKVLFIPLNLIIMIISLQLMIRYSYKVTFVAKSCDQSTYYLLYVYIYDFEYDINISSLTQCMCVLCID